jgi:hypothetical protein
MLVAIDTGGMPSTTSASAIAGPVIAIAARTERFSLNFPTSGQSLLLLQLNRIHGAIFLLRIVLICKLSEGSLYVKPVAN